MQEVRSLAFYDEKMCRLVEKTLKEMKTEIKVFDEVNVRVEKCKIHQRWYIVIYILTNRHQWLREFCRVGYQRIRGLRYRLKSQHEKINLFYSCKPFKGWSYEPYQMVVSPT